MAITTRNRRASCLVLALPFGRVWPSPDGSLANQADRQHCAHLYAAVLTAIVVTIFNGIGTSIRLTKVGS